MESMGVEAPHELPQERALFLDHMSLAYDHHPVLRQSGHDSVRDGREGERDSIAPDHGVEFPAGNGIHRRT
jgi:hypothetical protein